MLERSKSSNDGHFKNEFIDIILDLNLKNIHQNSYVNVTRDIGIFHEKFKPLILNEMKNIIHFIKKNLFLSKINSI